LPRIDAPVHALDQLEIMHNELETPKGENHESTWILEPVLVLVIKPALYEAMTVVVPDGKRRIEH
jgi:hypothetical protein